MKKIDLDAALMMAARCKKARVLAGPYADYGLSLDDLVDALLVIEGAYVQLVDSSRAAITRANRQVTAAEARYARLAKRTGSTAEPIDDVHVE